MARKPVSIIGTFKGSYLVTHLLTKSEATLDSPKYLVQCVQCGASEVYTKAALLKRPLCPHRRKPLAVTPTHIEVPAHADLDAFLSPSAVHPTAATVLVPNPNPNLFPNPHQPPQPTLQPIRLDWSKT